MKQIVCVDPPLVTPKFISYTKELSSLVCKTGVNLLLDISCLDVCHREGQLSKNTRITGVLHIIMNE